MINLNNIYLLFLFYPFLSGKIGGVGFFLGSIFSPLLCLNFVGTLVIVGEVFAGVFALLPEPWRICVLILMDIFSLKSLSVVFLL